MMVLTPLRWVLAWLLLVVADFRVNGFDLLPDALGWFVAGALLLSLGSFQAWFTAAGWVALTAGALSLLEYVGLDGGALVGVLDSLAQTALVWTTATAVVALVPPLAGEGRVLRWYSVGTLVLLSPVVLLDGAVAPLGPGGNVVVGLGAAAFILVEVIWFVSYLWRAAARPVDPRLVSPGPAAPAPGG